MSHLKESSFKGCDFTENCETILYTGAQANLTELLGVLVCHQSYIEAVVEALSFVWFSPVV